MVKRFQNNISESRFLLATVAFITVVIWLLSGMLCVNTAVNFAIIAVTSYFLVELDTRNSIIRIYSRMIPSAFLLLSTMTGMAAGSKFAITAFLFTMFLIFLFSSYQDRSSAGRVFYAFLCLGLASLLFVQILFFIPFIWFAMQTNLMSLSRKTTAASLLGTLLPYWFLGGYLLLTGDISYFAEHFSEAASFSSMFCYESVESGTWAGVITIAVLSLIGTVHFLRNSNKDKIRTRMFMEMIILLNLITFVFIVLQPVHLMSLLPIAVITASVLISHFIVLTSTKITNRTVYLIIAAVASVTVYNLWIS